MIRVLYSAGGLPLWRDADGTRIGAVLTGEVVLEVRTVDDQFSLVMTRTGKVGMLQTCTPFVERLSLGDPTI